MNTFRPACRLLTLYGCLSSISFVFAEAIPGGPETTLDSIWASTAHVQAITDTCATQITKERFQDPNTSRIWLNSLSSFGDARVRNNQPAFDYSATGYAVGYDYSKNGSILGLSLGQVFGHQKIKAMPDHPDGPILGDRFKQDTFMASLYGGLCRQTGPNSDLILAMNIGFGSTRNKCSHSDPHPEKNKWDTTTASTSLSAAWRCQVTSSFSVTPFIGLNYVHADNERKRDNGNTCNGDGYWDDDGDWVDTDCRTRMDNLGKFDSLSLEAGITLEHMIHFRNGYTWTNSLSGSFCPDVLRNDPHHTFVDGWWEDGNYYEDHYRGKGYSPSRQAFKARFTSRFTTGSQSSVYASYQAVFRDAYTAHQIALGFSHSF